MRSRVCCAVLLAVALLGCSSAGEPAAGPGESDSPESSSAASPTAPESSPSLTPAKGKRIAAEVWSYQLPDADWSLGRGGLTANLTDDAGRSWTIDEAHGPAFSTSSLDSLVANTLELEASQPIRLARSQNRTVNGVEGYVIEGSGREGVFYEFGAIHGDSWVHLQFDFPENSQQAQDWVESVLASVEWK